MSEATARALSNLIAEHDKLIEQNDALRRLISDNHEAYLQVIGVKGVHDG